MATIHIGTTQEEQEAVLKAIKELEGQTVPVSKIASVACISASRTRYVITDLLESGKIRREASKAFNKHYVRYMYFLSA